MSSAATANIGAHRKAFSGVRRRSAARTATILATLLGFTIVSSAQEQRSTELLDSLLAETRKNGFARTLQTISRSREQSLIAPLIDLLRFVKTREDIAALTKTLNDLIDVRIDLGDDPHRAYSDWYGAHPELEPPPKYVGWKGRLLASRVDPRFTVFLPDDAKATIRAEEILWGGVKVAGIPSLDNPKTLTADKGDYLECERFVRPRNRGRVAVRCKRLAFTTV